MTTPRATHASGATPARGEGGFTLIEIIVAMLVSTLVTLGVSQVIISTFQDSQRTIDHLSSSNSAFLTDARFREDIAAAARPDDAVLPADWTAAVATIGRNQTGCGGDPSLLRILSPAPTGTNIQMVSYARIGPALVRRRCTGATIAATTGSPASSIRAVPALSARVSPPVVVTCRATAAADPVTDDSLCRIVGLTVTTATEYAFTLTGVRTTSDHPVGSRRLTHQCTLLASASANVYQDQPNRNFNDHDDFGGAGRTFIEDRGRTSWVIRGFLQFDLAGTCQGTDQGEPPFMPAGKVLTTATLRLTYHDATVDSSNNRCSGQHYLNVLTQAWDPTLLTWNAGVNLDLDLDGTTPIPAGHTPSRQASASIGLSTLASAADVPWSTDVLSIVRHWYPGAPGAGSGDWANDGWVMSSLTNPCDSLRSYKWMSKGSNDDLSPRLVISWSE